MKSISTRPRGRPLSFDRDKVLDAAVQVFWEKGYEGASVGDLTKAMGINPPSLYAKFGNKHGLFLQAIDRYVATITSTQLTPLIEMSDIKQAVSGYFVELIRCVASQDWPAGCMVVCVATEAAERDEIVRAKVSNLLEYAETFIAQRIADSVSDNPPLKVDDPKKIARMIVAIGQGLAARARAGASKDDLLDLAKDFEERLF
jgi:AcrR family transcriptional regulator